MHPSWIGLLLAAVRSFSGHIPKSVVFREWFLSFRHNYTHSWLMSWSILPPPARAKTSLFPALFIFPGTIREGRMAMRRAALGSPYRKKCSDITHSTVPIQTRHPFHPSQKLPRLVNAAWSTGNSWQETSCYFLDVHRPPSPQHPRAHQHRSTSVKHGPLITHIRDHLLKWILGNLHPPNFPSVSFSTGHNHRRNITCECPAGTGP